MDRKLFTSLLSKHLYPRLRAEGFRGSGTTLRRVEEPVVEVFNVQGSSGGDRCYFNLGLHLTFLPAEGGQLVAPRDLSESHCAFRARIDPPAGQQFGWSYGSSESEAESNASRAVLEWERQAKPFLRTTRTEWPQPHARRTVACYGPPLPPTDFRSRCPPARATRASSAYRPLCAGARSFASFRLAVLDQHVS